MSAYDQEEGTREQIARRFRVSLGMVKKLLQQRRHTGDIAPQHHRSGRKRMILESHRHELRTLLTKKPDLSLEEMRVALALPCSVQAIHMVLTKMGLTYKKRHSAPANKTGRTSRRRGESGNASSRSLIRVV